MRGYIAQAEAKLKPKPLDERIRTFLDKLDSGILPQLAEAKKAGLSEGIVKCDLPQATAETLRELCAEEGAAEYIRFESRGDVSIKRPLNHGPVLGGTFVDVKLFISTKLIESQERTPKMSN